MIEKRNEILKKNNQKKKYWKNDQKKKYRKNDQKKKYRKKEQLKQQQTVSDNQSNNDIK